MDAETLDKAADPRALADYVADLKPMGHMGGAGGLIESVREANYQGHKITIKTTYRLEVDGRVFDVPLILDNAGNLQCHSLPNYQFVSAIDMVKQLIETFPDDFAPGAAPPMPNPMPDMPGMTQGGGH